MNIETTDTGHVAEDLPESWRASLSEVLNDRETIISWFTIDLDSHLRFAPGLLVVTDQRVLSKETDDTEWQVWAFRPGLVMTHHDHAGVGTLELRDSKSRLAVWRYTLGHNTRRPAIHCQL